MAVYCLRMEKQPAPLRTIVDRPDNTSERLECGHMIVRPLALGEPAFLPSKALRRRCYHCAASLEKLKAST